jgi:hypothetical protein
VNQSVGKFLLFAIPLLGILSSSCIFAPADKPLNPNLLFTVGSEFLDNSQSIAIKGSIDFEDGRNRESGTFNLIMNRGDSLAFLVEGPFKVDIFKMLILSNTAYAIDRESDDWTVAASDEKFMMPDYGIDGISPDLLKYCVFPQFFLQNNLSLNPEISTVWYDKYTFRVIPSRNQKTFVLRDSDFSLLIFYSRRKDYGGGYYPSTIEISPYEKSWQIRFEIDKIRLDPDIPLKIWDRD